MDKGSQEIATVDTEASKDAQKKEIISPAKKKIIGTRQITYRAILVALALIFKLLGQYLQFGDFKITFVYIPWIISAIAMGPLGGAAVAFLTDLIGTFILPTGGLPLPLSMLSTTLMGLIYGFAFMIPKIDPKLKLVIGTIVALFTCTLGIGTYSIAWATNVPFEVLFVKRLALQAPVLIGNAVVVGLLFPVLRKLGLMK